MILITDSALGMAMIFKYSVIQLYIFNVMLLATILS